MADSSGYDDIHARVHYVSRILFCGLATLGAALVLVAAALVWSGILTW